MGWGWGGEDGDGVGRIGDGMGRIGDGMGRIGGWGGEDGDGMGRIGGWDGEDRLTLWIHYNDWEAFRGVLCGGNCYEQGVQLIRWIQLTFP